MLNLKWHLETVNNLPEQGMQGLDLYSMQLQTPKSVIFKTKIQLTLPYKYCNFFLSYGLELRSLALLSTFILN